MKAVLMSRYGGPDVLEYTDVACPVAGKGEVLVRIKAAAVNPADYKWRSGLFREQAPVPFPHILGYDIAGDVVHGEDVAPGTAVFAMLNPFLKGGYAEYVAVPLSRIAVMPEGVDYSVAASIPTAGLTGLQMVEEILGNSASSRFSEGLRPTLLITGGLGAVGRFAFAVAKAAGARVMLAVRAGREAEALALGADSVVVLEGEARLPEAAHHMIDTVGGDAVVPLCRQLEPGARILTAATEAIAVDGLSTAVEFFAVHPDGDGLSRLGKMVADGQVDLPIAERLPLARAADAHGRVEKGHLKGKIVLIP